MIKTITLALLLATTPAAAQYLIPNAPQGPRSPSSFDADRAMEQMRQREMFEQLQRPRTCTQTCVPLGTGMQQCTTNCY
jgi:hypothetical protein